MKILKNNIQNLISNPLKSGLKGVLFYGADVGVVNHRVAEIKRSFGDFEFIKIDLNGEKILRDLDAECFTSSFFTSSKLIYVVGSEAKMLGIWDVLTKIHAEFQNFLIFVVMDNMDAKSKVRKFFEDEKLFGAVACFADEESDTLLLIQDFAKKNKLVLDLDAIDFILKNFGKNRGVLLAELEKLKLYKGEGRVTLRDAGNIMDEHLESDFFEAVNLFFNLKFDEFEKEALRLEGDGVHPSAFISHCINYLFKLIDISEEKDRTGKSFDSVMQEKFIFFKQIPKMKEHLSRWNKEELHFLLKNLIDAEVFLREHSEVSFWVFEKILLSKQFGN